MFCKNCGKNLKGQYNICPYCKSDLSNDSMNTILREQIQMKEYQRRTLNGDNRLALPLILLVSIIIADFIILNCTLLEFVKMTYTLIAAIIILTASVVCLLSKEYQKGIVAITILLCIVNFYTYKYNYDRAVDIANSSFESISELSEWSSKGISPNNKHTSAPTESPSISTTPNTDIVDTPTTTKPTTSIADNITAKSSLPNYQEIYDEYSAKLIAAGPTSSINEMAEILNEGVGKMASYMFSASGTDGQYATYEDWASKLMDVYMSECR